MANENGWGAPRIHGELVKLGFRVSERTVSRYMRQHRRRPERRQNWLTFLRNHREVIVAMDFFVVPTATFRLLYVWFAIRHSRREIVHWCVTESPTAPWVVQQLREAFPFDEAGRGSRYLVFDRDTIFSSEVVAAVASMAIEPTRTSYQSPWQNGVAERFVGTVRRELLDHAIVLDDRHLRRLLNEYLAYYHEDRTHLGVDKDAPLARGVEPRPNGAAAVHARPRVGGLHHRYSWGAAAQAKPPRRGAPAAAARGWLARKRADRRRTARGSRDGQPEPLPDDGTAGARPRRSGLPAQSDAGSEPDASSGRPILARLTDLRFGEAHRVKCGECSHQTFLEELPRR